MNLPVRTKMLQEAVTPGKGFIWILELLICFPVFLVSQFLQMIPTGIGLIVWIYSVPGLLDPAVSALRAMDFQGYSREILRVLSAIPDWMVLIQLVSTLFTILTVLLFCRVIQKRRASSLGLRKGHFFREFLIGSGVGILLISAAVGICMLTGTIRLVPTDYSGFILFLFLLCFLIQGASEEILCRGYLMVSVSRRNALWLAIITNSVLFALLHIMNGGVTPLSLFNIALFGIFESVYVLKRGNLWGACAIHSFWNFFQGNVFGINVSGIPTGTSLFDAECIGNRTLITGGEFGLEGGLAVTAVFALALLFALFVMKTNPEELPDKR